MPRKAALPRTADSAPKTMNTKITMISAPAAGRARKRWVRDSCRSRSDPGAFGAAVVVLAIVPSEGVGGRDRRTGPSRCAGPPARERSLAETLRREGDHVSRRVLG